MSLFDTARDDAQHILEGADGFTVPVLFQSPPPGNVEYGTLDPDDTANHILAWIGDHYTQYDPETGVPQEGLNAKATLTLKTLLDKGIIVDVTNPDFKEWKLSFLDITDPTKQRDFLIERIHPTRSLGHVVFILGEIEIT